MTKKFDGYIRKTSQDLHIEEMIKNHCEKYDIEPLDAIKMFPILIRRQWLKRFLAHTELFKKTLEIPGDIADLGVFRGISLFTWANLLESYCIGNRTKIVYGFDNWKGFVEYSPEDKDVSEQVIDSFSPEMYYDELIDSIKIFDEDRFVPWKDRIRLVRGNIEYIVPKFLKKNPGVRFSLIHFDCDLYLPTKISLENLWPVLSRGGIILFDEYGIHDWSGETKAVDEFLERNPEIKLKTFNWTNTPAAYIIKE